jgi:hypothetical protein
MILDIAHLLLDVSKTIEFALTNLTRSLGGSMRQLLLPIRLIAIGFTLTIAYSVSWSQVSADQCGDYRSNLQWDYRKATEKQHIEVEGAHFVPKVENLIAGNRGSLGGDLHYTLGASPNHHRALVSITRWSERLKRTQLPNMPFPVECYFVRGLAFTPDDNVVRMLYAQFLIGQTRAGDAVKQLERVSSTAGDNGFTMYNIGLIYFDMKNYAQALAFAHKATAFGFLRTELRQELERVGHWAEPVTGAVERAASAPAQTPVSAAPSATPAKD